ncbi:TPA: metalloprotease family protein [Staphylococcus argenteus]|uniref:metalloprotease family protein n=1 Tax=Staphylococcus argenteus TaxID=985002 RepID=UPI00044E9BC7|nr:metalloprotease family protein [Staphylococcus argenteus]BBN30929.1 hypothetical protein KUH140087_1800 [Staphylococcus aureus]ATY55773.1 hypothetical protein CJ017_00265 [Staphylococcus argenteus]ATZ86011.1 hypothetical protein CKO49_00265 [Staphylococcus argenteus]EKF1504415.1 DUF3267 domain-containing protein [Staphylococcus argenteus]EYG84889.1 hypothetical protein V676_02538 [Staphylococcus argenteus]
MNFVLIILNLLLSFIIVALIHEFTHLIFLKIFKRENIRINIRIFFVSITYKNNHNPLQNLIIAISAPVICLCIGLIMLSLGKLNFITLIFLTNVFNFLPLTQDGQVILISLIDIFKDKK